MCLRPLNTLVYVTLLCVLSTAITPRAASAQNFEIDIEQFDQWIFSNMQSPDNARRVLSNRIETEIDRIALTTDLTESQKDKIRLAGKGDIKRFFDDVERAHRAFAEMQEAGEVDQQNMNKVYQLAMPLQQRLARGLFDRDSLLRKVARGSVDQLQAKELQVREARLNRLKTDAVIAAVIANLGRQTSMLHAQRHALNDLLVKRVKIKDPSSRYASYIVLYQMSELPEKKLEAIFDKVQLDALKKNFVQAAAMKQTLKQMGELDE